jgi:hypothetical protein
MYKVLTALRIHIMAFWAISPSEDGGNIFLRNVDTYQTKSCHNRENRHMKCHRVFII